MTGRGAGTGRGFLIYAVGRPLLLIGWSLILWGTVLWLPLLWALLDGGPREAAALVARLGRGGPWGWLSIALGTVAPLIWALVTVAIVSRRRGRRTDGGA